MTPAVSETLWAGRYHCSALWSRQVPGRGSSSITHQEECAVPGDQQRQCGSVEASVQAMDRPPGSPNLKVNCRQCALMPRHCHAHLAFACQCSSCTAAFSLAVEMLVLLLIC